MFGSCAAGYVEHMPSYGKVHLWRSGFELFAKTILKKTDKYRIIIAFSLLTSV